MIKSTEKKCLDKASTLILCYLLKNSSTIILYLSIGNLYK